MSHLFKTIVVLYISFSFLWVLGSFRSTYLKLAINSTVIFLLGLGLGRVLSFFRDDTPTFGNQFGTFVELFLGCQGIWVLTNKNTNFAKKINYFGKNRQHRTP